MSRKSVFAVALVAIVLATVGSALPAQAAGEPNQVCPAVYNPDQRVWVEGVYCDGRLNAFDVDQPVAIFYARQPERVVDDKGRAYITDAIVGIEFWTVNANGQGQLAMWVPVDDVESAFDSASDVEVASQNGVTLRYSPAANALTAALGSYAFTWKVW